MHPIFEKNKYNKQTKALILVTALFFSLSCSKKKEKVDEVPKEKSILHEDNFDRVQLKGTQFTFLQARAWDNQLIAEEEKEKESPKKEKKKKKHSKKSKKKSKKKVIEELELENHLVFTSQPRKTSGKNFTNFQIYRVRNIPKDISPLEFTQQQREENQKVIESMPKELNAQFRNINIEPKSINSIQAYSMRNQWTMEISSASKDIRQESLLFISGNETERNGYIFVATYLFDASKKEIKDQISEIRHILSSIQMQKK